MTAPSMPRAGGDGVTRLITRLAAAQASVRQRALVAAGLAGVTLVALVVAAGAIALAEGRWMQWPRIVPFGVWGVAGICVALVMRRVRDGLSTWEQLPRFAELVERELACRGGSVRGALEVGMSGALGARAAEDAAARLPSAALTPNLTARLQRAVGITVGTASAATLVGLLVARTHGDGLAPLWHPMRAWRGTLLPALTFDRLPARVPRGMPVTVHVRAEGRQRITLAYRAAGEPWRDTVLAIDPATGSARLALGPVRAPTSLRVSDGRAPVLHADLGVEDRGWIGDVALYADYPAYLGRSGEVLEAVSPVRVPRGTRVHVTARLRGGVVAAQLSDGSARAAFKVDTTPVSGRDGIPAAGVLTLDHDGVWGWSAQGATLGGATLAPELPDSLHFVVLPDKVPEVLIAEPETDVAIPTAGTVSVQIRAADDHGISRVALTVWREPAEAAGRAHPGAREQLAIAEPGDPFFDGSITVPLDGRGLAAGDRLHLQALAVDDSPWRQQALSRDVVLRVPTLSEQRAMARSLADSLAARAQQMAQQERALQQNTADAARSRDLKADARGADQGETGKSGAGKAAMSFQAAERARKLARDQQQMSAKVDSLRQSAKALEDRLKGANALDTALSNQMRDIQRMLREAMTPEMQKQLDALNKSADKLSGTEAQRSMEQLAAQQQQLRQQLEKSAEMLKRAALEGSMSTLRDEAKELGAAQQRMADALQKAGDRAGQPGTSQSSPPPDQKDAKSLADRSRALQDEVNRLAQRLDDAGAKPGAAKTRQAQPLVGNATDAMQRAARDLSNTPQQQSGQQQSGQQQSGQQQNGQQQNGQQQSGQQQSGQQQSGQQGNQQAGLQRASEASRQAGQAMNAAAQQLAAARESQVNAWKGELSDQLDQSINETMQLARQQADLAQRARQSGDAQSLQGEQGALQQGVQQAAERLEQAARSSSLLSQRSQKAMADAQRRVQQATQQMGQAGGAEQSQNAMRDATEALNQALSSLVRDRERVNGAQSASGFSEMMEQLKQLAQKQGALNGQMQGLNMLPGGAQGDAARQQARVLARQQRDVAKTLSDVSDLDQTGRTDALAKEAQMLSQQIERAGALDPNVAARQQQLYRRLLDAGRFLEQEERDDQGPREATAATGNGSKGPVTGPATGKAANKFVAPTWNDLRGLGAEDRRLVIEYFRRLNGSPP